MGSFFCAFIINRFAVKESLNYVVSFFLEKDTKKTFLTAHVGVIFLKSINVELNFLEPSGNPPYCGLVHCFPPLQSSVCKRYALFVRVFGYEISSSRKISLSSIFLKECYVFSGLHKNV